MFQKIIDRHFSSCIYVFALASYGIILIQGLNENLFPMPIAGTDQLSMVEAAVGIYKGHMPREPYLYSISYTFFLTLLIFISQGSLVLMRLLQAALCALIPVMIYKTGRKIGLAREASQFSSLIYCFYGAAALISLDFLREAPLALCFILFTYLLVSGVLSQKNLTRALSTLQRLDRSAFIRLRRIPHRLENAACASYPQIRGGQRGRVAVSNARIERLRIQAHVAGVHGVGPSGACLSEL